LHLAWQLRNIISTTIVLIWIVGKPAAIADEDSWAAAIGNLAQGDRVEAANNIGEFCGLIAQAIPTLSPRERDWLDLELHSPRALATTKTIEFSKKFAGETARGCVAYTEILLTLPEKNPETIQPSEAFLWAQLASQLLKPDFHWHVDNLQRNGVVSFSKVMMAQIQLVPMLGKTILDKIIISHLRNEISPNAVPSP
jgi:hypothetical protein